MYNCTNKNLDTPRRTNALSDRMRDYERATRKVLPPRAWTIVRMDGKSFSAYTRNLNKPFDDRFATDMDSTAHALVSDYPGAAMAYVASDEISLITNDLSGPHTQPHMGGVLPKLVSLTAAKATAVFNAIRADLHTDLAPASLPLFDSRAFTVPDVEEVTAYLAWRAADTRRNSLAMLCDAHLGKSATRGKGTADRVQMLADAGIDWAALDRRHAAGRIIVPTHVQTPVTYTRTDTGAVHTSVTARKTWVVQTAPERFTSADLLLGMLATG